MIVDIKHPKRSTCTCPFAEGRSVVCKHMVALYCEAFPEKEIEILKLIDEENKFIKQEAEKQRAKQIRWIHQHVMSLSKAELREELLTRMLEDLDNEENPYYW